MVSSSTARSSSVQPATVKQATVNSGPCCCADAGPVTPPVTPPIDFGFLANTLGAEDFRFLGGQDFQFIQQ